MATFNLSIARQIHGRRILPRELEKIQRSARNAPKRAIFFCSSAGEFEQALPLISRLEKRQVFTHTFLFSKSGVEFAEARKIKHSYSLAPFDLPWIWNSILSAISPDFGVVIRYELWPGFLISASRICPLYLVNVSHISGNGGFIRNRLLNYFSGIFVVSNDEVIKFNRINKSIKKAVVGDTKYDRVIERSLENSPHIRELREKISETYADRAVIILGSCWDADLDIFFSAWKQLSEKLRNHFAIVIAPHDISKDHLNDIETKLRSINQDFIRFSRWMNDPRLGHGGVFLLVDTMGKLAELYGAAHGAMVGGAFHHKIHNVLEPASHALDVCFGPRYHSQKEAKLLVEMGIATVIETQEDLKNWLLRPSTERVKSGQRAYKQVKDLAGATDKILATIPEIQS